jgi:hypothetical protein
MPFEEFEKIPTPPGEEGKEKIEEMELENREMKEFEESLEELIGPERLEKVKERAAENLGVSINSELLISEFEDKEFFEKTVREAKILAKEKLPELSEEKRQIWEEHLKKSDEEIEELLKENERKYIEFERTREESLRWFIESDIKNIRINPWHPESWLNWENVEKGKSGEFEIDPRGEEIIDRLVKAEKNIDLVIPFGNKNYFGKENRYKIPSSEEEIKAYTNFCGFLAEHFKEKINRFEISSEPNAKPKGLGEKFVEGFPENSDPELYGKVAARAAEIIKEKNPKAEIIFGSVALFDPEFIEKGLEEVKKYEKKLKKEGKLKSDQHLFDYVGFHPYREKPEDPSATVEKGIGQFKKEQDEMARKKYGYTFYDDQIEIYQRIIKKYSPNVKLINTEVGWQTTAPEEHSYVPDEKTRAECLLKAAAIDASHGISTNFFELFEKAIGEKSSLLSKENKPKEGIKNLEKFNKYLEFLKSKEITENWFETKKESLKEQARLTFSELYKKVFPERNFNIEFLNPQEFTNYCREKKLPLPFGKKPQEILFNRFKEKNTMNYLINEEKFRETLKQNIEFGKREGKKMEEIVEKIIIKLGVHEIRHDLHEEKMTNPITPETLPKDFQKEYKKILTSLQKEGMLSDQISEECDVMIVEKAVEKLWERNVKDMDLISKIVRYGDGSKIGAISQSLKEKKITTPQLLEKIKRIF